MFEFMLIEYWKTIDLVEREIQCPLLCLVVKILRFCIEVCAELQEFKNIFLI